MNTTADELAGVVDLFGGLTREELETALSEAAFRADGQSVDDAAVEGAVEDALESFALVRYQPADEAVDEPLLVAGPTAFPTTPAHAEDVPHILDIERRRLDRVELGDAAQRRFARAVDEALKADDVDRLEELLDVSYDLEAWKPIDLASERARLDDGLAALEGGSGVE